MRSDNLDCGMPWRPWNALGEQSPQQFVSAQFGVVGHVAQDRAECADLDRIMGRDRHMVLASAWSGESNVASCLMGLLIAES